MRKAKVAAFIIGGVSTCIFGGIFGFYATSQTVSPVAPNNDVRNVYEVENERLANVAAVTSIMPMPIADINTSTYNEDSSTAAVQDVEAQEMWIKPAYDEYIYNEPVYTDYSYNEPVYNDYSYSEPVYTENTPENYYSEPVYDQSVSQYAYGDSYSYDYSYDYNYDYDYDYNYDYGYDYSYDYNYDYSYDLSYESVYQETFTPEPEVVVSPSYDYTDVYVPEVYGPSIPSGNSYITDAEYVILCNAVAHEAGSSWISTYDKAKVVEVIMNRVYNSIYPNSIIDVLVQYNQFSGAESYVYLGTYSSDVSDDVKAAVDLYFSDPSSFSHGYFGFYGDGVHNYFY